MYIGIVFKLCHCIIFVQLHYFLSQNIGEKNRYCDPLSKSCLLHGVFTLCIHEEKDLNAISVRVKFILVFQLAMLHVREKELPEDQHS